MASIIRIAEDIERFQRAVVHLDGRLPQPEDQQFREELQLQLRQINAWLDTWREHDARVNQG